MFAHSPKFLHSVTFQVSLLIILISIPYLNSLSNGFVWVDTAEILNGQLIISSFEDLKEIFFNDDNNYSGYHRPIYNLMHSIDYLLWKNNAFGFHLSNLFFHLLNSIFLYILLQKLHLKISESFCIALIWGLLPANTSVVSLIHSKADLIVTFFILNAFLTIIFICENFKTFSIKAILLLIISLLFFCLALLSKETAFVAPLVLSILLYFNFYKTNKQISLAIIYIFNITTILFILARFLSNSLSNQSSEFLPFYDRILSFIPVYVDYILKTFSSIELTENDSILIWKYFSIHTFISYIILFCLFIYFQFRFNKNFYIWFGFIWYNVFLIPVSQLFPILHFRADRFLYLPSIGLILAVFFLLKEIYFASLLKFENYRIGIKYAFVGLFISTTLFFSFRIKNRNNIFLNDFTLFENVVQQYPYCKEAHSFLARAYLLEGNYTNAYKSFAISLSKIKEIYSFEDHTANITNYGLYLIRTKNYVEGYKLYKELITKKNVNNEIYFNLSICCKNINKYQEAHSYLTKYLSHIPTNSDALFLLGEISYLIKDYNTCKSAFNKYLELNPNAHDKTNVLFILNNLK